MNKLKIFIIITMIFLLTGCGDYRELSDMALASSIGIDKVNNKYMVITQVLDSKAKSSSDSSQSKPKIVTYKSEGSTIHEALRNVLLESPKKLYIGHIKTVVISEKVAKEDISNIFDFFLRDAEASKNFKILLVKDYSIENIMNALTPLQTIPAENVSSSIEIGSKLQGSIDDVTFDKFASNVLLTGVDAVIPVITIKEIESSDEESNPSKRIVVLKEMGIFDDNKFVTYISENSSLGYNIIKNNVESNVISFKCSSNKYGSIELIKNKSNLSYDIKKQTLSLNVNIEGTISELDCNVNLNAESNIIKLEKLAEKQLTSIMNETIDSAVKYSESDFLGIGQFIFRNNYKYYQKNKDNIRNIIKNINRNISVNVVFTQKGTIKEGDEKY